MMAIESSVLDCGSDNWSVDSDYAFQDFADDDLQQQKIADQDLQSSPERAHLGTNTLAITPQTTTAIGVGGVPASVLSTAKGSNPEDEVERVSHRALNLYEEHSSGEAVSTPGVEEARVLCERGVGVGTKRVDNNAGVVREEHAACEARPFGDPGSSTDSAHILRLEQRMFLKAAFQLLEERDSLFSASFGWGNSGSNWGGGLGTRSSHGGVQGGGRGAVGASGGASVSAGEGRVRLQGGGVFVGRVLRSGALRKATARSVGRLETTTWKTKYVELTPGRFAYADGSSVLGKKSRSAKVILLHLGFCICRPVKSKDLTRNGSVAAKPRGKGGAGSGAGGSGTGGGVGGNGGTGSKKHLLEIEVVGSKRRVWAAESKRECRRWVRAIKGAMTERPVDPMETTMGENQLPKIPQDSVHRGHMESYLAAKASLRTATTIVDYLAALQDLRMAVKKQQGVLSRAGEDTPLGVPVKWVKQQLPGAERAYQVPTRHRGKSELAQLWKDMKRDTVSINRRVLKGERGPEAIVGALTRCILAQAGRLPATDSLSKLSEAQSLLAARDVLLACDRTISGGDTYLVVDNLCRNPDLVVLVPASQEAEPLKIQVSLHPQIQAPLQAQPSSTFRGSTDRNGGAMTPTHQPLTTGQAVPPSPSSVGVRSPPSSPFTARDPGPAPGAVVGDADAAASTPGPEESSASGWRRRMSPGGDAAGASVPPTLGGRTSDAAESKRRGRLTLSARRPKLTRAGSGIGVRGARTAPEADPHLASSWDGGAAAAVVAADGGGYQDVATATPDSNGAMSPTLRGGQQSPPPSVDERESLRGSNSGRPSGGGIFASIARHRAGDGAQKPGGRSSASGTRALAAAPLSAREVSGGHGSSGIGAGAVWRGSSSAPAAATSTSSAFFADDTDDAGHESGSSYEEEEEDDDGDGPPSKRSYIRVACTARTSYKLFSSDPQDEERDVYAVVTGLFEQTFTISREYASRSARRRSSGMGGATRTEGSVAFLTFHEPRVKRQSIDSSQGTDTATEAAAAAAAAAAATEAVVPAAIPASIDLSASENTGNGAGCGRGDRVNGDKGHRRTSVGVQDIRRSESAETDNKRSWRSAAAGTMPHELDGTTTIHANRSGSESVVVAEPPETPQRDRRTGEAGESRQNQRIDYPASRWNRNGDSKHCGRETNGADEASVDMPRRLTVSVATVLTPESVIPVPFSPGSTGAGSMASSGVSPRAHSPISPACRDVRSGKKVSSVAEILQHGAAEEAVVEALRLESLELFSDEDDA